MDTTDCNNLFDFDEIYNQSHTYIAPIETRVKLRNTAHLVKYGDDTYCNLDDFPFVRDKLYSKCTSMAKRSPPVSRAYEEAYLVEGMGKEGCSEGDACECVKMYGFTLRQFEFPDIDFGGRCLLCIRTMTLRLYLDVRSNNITPERVIFIMEVYLKN